jgi:predicted dehydrogenase
MAKVKWGIIGCGDVTEVKSGPAFNKVNDSKLVAVMRRNGAKAKDYAERHNVPSYYSNADELINHPDVNAIYVATPPDTHAEYAIRAMLAGKAVYVEKPMAASYKECMKMMAIAEQTKAPLFVAYYRRTLPGYLKVKELIEMGAIGKPISIAIELIRPPLESELKGGDSWWRVDPLKGGAGIFFDLASHQFDFLDYLFGPVADCKGYPRNIGGHYQAEDTVTASFVFENGVVGTGQWCFTGSEVSKRDKMEIFGTKGRIVFTGFDHSPIQFFSNEGLLEFPYLNPENIQYNLIKQVVEAITGQGDCVSTGYSAMRTNKVIEAIVADYYRR